MAKKKSKYAVPSYAITERGLKKLIEKASKEEGSMSSWAIKHKITPQVVSAFMRKVQGAGLQIPEALGYKPQIVFIPLDAEEISHANPPRRATDRPSKKVDHTRQPIDVASRRKVNDRDETKKRLKARK